MFHDPNKELKELEGQLLAAEESQEMAMLDEAEFEALYDEILEEFGPKNREEDNTVRNFANGYGGSFPPVPQPEEYMDEEPIPAEPKVRGNGGLIFTIFLELCAIAGVLAFWIMSLLW